MLDVESFAAQLTGSYRRLWLIAAAITGDRTEADDIVQDAALVALRKLDEFTTGTSFSAWMSQIVRLTALNHLRKSNRQSTLPTDPLTLDRVGTLAPTHRNSDNSTVSQEGHLAQLQTEFDDEVLGALQSVSDIGRACLLLRIIEQLSYAEIAEALQIPQGTAMSHVHRGREQLRQRLQGRYSPSLDSPDKTTPL
ncbi:MAG TPA: RNA polymerase sigma factor [Pirellulales bacterium]|nr:RNA polymerase sigma factor [Pirellulales bacterium]